MELSVGNIVRNYQSLVKGATIDLSDISFIPPWGLSFLCLLAVEHHTDPSKKIILPRVIEVQTYLKRMHFQEILKELNYENESTAINSLVIPERTNPDLQELVHCRYVDEFTGRLARFHNMFQRFGLSDEDSERATNLIAELGNNVFDHNLGNWPTEIGGAFVTAQRFPLRKIIDVVVADPGVGFLGSLKPGYPKLHNDIEAITLGLSGKTGRIGEKRGNGLRYIQNWTIKDFGGNLIIHSNGGMVKVDKTGQKSDVVPRILGTIAQFEIYYNQQ